jgi:hypothetical protein
MGYVRDDQGTAGFLAWSANPLEPIASKSFAEALHYSIEIVTM